MKTSQLRLGNLIKIKKPILKDLIDEGFQKIYTDRTTVIYVGYDYLGVIIDNSEVEIMLQDIEPIPLTEEWLLKLGFEYNGWNYEKKFFTVHSQRLANHKQFNEFIEIHWLKRLIPIVGGVEFVHQLQNLYFCLVGEELTIKQ